MFDDFKLAWRNVWRNTRRSVVTMAAAAIALFVMILYTGLANGYLERLEGTILDLEVGDAQVFAEGYREKPSLYTAIRAGEGQDEGALDAAFAKLEAEGFEAAPRLLGVGLGASEDNSAGIQMIGIDVAADKDVGKIHERVFEGEWLSADEPGVVIGHRLADSLGLEVGGELVVLSQGADGSMANDLYPVRGILGGVSERVDRAGVFMRGDDFRELMVFYEGVHQVILRVPEQPDAPDKGLKAGADRAQAILDEAGVEQAQVSTWRELQPGLASMLETSAAGLAVMMAIIYIAVGIVVLNAMLMAVFERTREFGVLKAIGFGPMKVLRLILIETAIQGVFAVSAGILLAIPANYYMVHTGLDMSGDGNLSVMGMSIDPIWHSVVTLDTYLTPAIALVVIIALSVLYPALRAAFIQPLSALRD